MVAIQFAARDAADNVGTLNSSIQITPLSNPNAPKISLTCPSSNALFPAGWAIAVQASGGEAKPVFRSHHQRKDGLDLLDRLAQQKHGSRRIDRRRNPAYRLYGEVREEPFRGVAGDDYYNLAG